MNLSEDLQRQEISVQNTELIRHVLNELSPGQSPGEYPISQEEIESEISAIQEFDQVDDPNFPWKKYFRSEGESWYLDEGAVVGGWCATLRENHPIDIISLEHLDTLSYKVTVEGGNRGNVEFELIFDSEELLKRSPALSEGRFLVAFPLPRTGDDRDGVFVWSSITDDDFWDNVVSLLIEHRQPPDKPICQMNSPAVERNFDGVKDSIRRYVDKSEHKLREQPQLVKNIQRADEEVSISDMDFAVEVDEDSHIVMCQCTEVGAESFHAHMIVDGEAEPPENHDSAAKLIDAVHEKVRRYGDLIDDQDTSSKFVRIAGVVLVAGAFPAAQALISYTLGDGQSQLQDAYAVVGIAAIVIALITLAYLLKPLWDFRQFSWDDINPK